MENFKNITSYEDACRVNKQSSDLPIITRVDDKEAQDMINNMMLKRIVRALNTDQETGEVWEPNWNNRNELKYTAWVEVEADEDHPEGFAFSASYYYYWFASTVVGSRLCLKSSDRVMHLHKHFRELLLNVILIRK